jgi:hypothetical protein
MVSNVGNFFFRRSVKDCKAPMEVNESNETVYFACAFEMKIEEKQKQKRKRYFAENKVEGKLQ